MTGKSPPVQSVDKALRILTCFSKERPQLGITDLSNILSLNKSAVYRLVITLERRGFLVKSPDNGRYQVGPKAFELGTLFFAGTPFGIRVHTVLEGLTRTSGGTSELTILDEAQMLVIGIVENSSPVRIVADLGSRMPLHATASGKAALSLLPGDAQAGLLSPGALQRFTARTITDPRLLLGQLKEVAARGYAVERGEWVPGVSAISAPIRNFPGGRPAALTVVLPAHRMTEQSLAELVPILKTAVESLELNLGGRQLSGL